MLFTFQFLYWTEGSVFGKVHQNKECADDNPSAEIWTKWDDVVVYEDAN